ncbi:MAG: FtsX-like permease family protein [Candidatus Kapabacteria bacterium]|nr:FtsX-like permease family protein [Candidatus Kapabacteria bacterium]
MFLRAALRLLLWRWLLLRRRWGMIQLIAVLSVLGIGIGTATLLSVLSIFKGFHRAVESLLLRYEPHLRIVSSRGQWFSMAPDTIKHYARIAGAQAILPTISGRLIAQRGGSFAPAFFVAAPESAIRQATAIPQSVVVGDFEFQRNGMPAVVVGSGLAERLHVLPGDTVWLWTPTMLEQWALGIPMGTGFVCVVAAIFQAPAGEHHSFALYTDTAVGRRLFGTSPQTWSAVDFWLSGIDAVPEALNKLQRHISPLLQLLPWYELHRQLYEVLRLERLATFAVLSLIVLVSVFNIAASLRMSIAQKRREIALVQALGIATAEVRRLYLAQGLVLGTVGTAIGLIIGLGFYWGQQYWGWIRLDPAQYILSTLPVFLEPWDVAVVVGVALGLVLLAAIYPARWAARLPVAEALREE